LIRDSGFPARNRHGFTLGDRHFYLAQQHHNLLGAMHGAWQSA
jgi:hypothetical protein